MKKGLSFYAMVKNFNNGEVEKYDIMPALYNEIYDDDGNISPNFCVYDSKFNRLPVDSIEKLYEFVDNELRYHFWAKCEYEFIVIDWPYKTDCEDVINNNRAVKIDVYEQLKPNMHNIVNLLWEEIKDLL